MSETTNSETSESEKPGQFADDVKFPPFPVPTELEFDDDISEEEREYYKQKFKDLNTIKYERLHCTACDRHLGCSARNETRMRSHPMLRTLVCYTCHTFYNSGEFEKGDDGSELYCRWCGQGGQVYCCSDCPHVFCARCIKRNLGAPKIKEIENTDDWKCFKCNPKCLWDLRAICWALLRYCDQKNKITYATEDAELKESYRKDSALDHSECCKNKIKVRRKDKPEVVKKKEPEVVKKKEPEAAIQAKKSTASIISKISPAIQVKKFASIVPDDKQEKKAQKRPLSPKQKFFIKNPIAITQGSSVINPISISSSPKKIRITGPPMINPVRFNNDRKQNPITFQRIRPKGLPIAVMPTPYNGYNNTQSYTSMVANDNINLSLDNLTQGLDMSAVAAMSNSNPQDDDVVCTPDFPLEPLCEVTEDNVDDDVQCITPVPVPKMSSIPPIMSRTGTLPDLTSDNIVQMTENDVTVNAATGGLKFRVDPQTLSSNKMYRLPDGRIFAINANPAMPGGYSATIVAVTESTQGKASVPKGATFAAKLSAVSSPASSTPPPLKSYGRITRSSTIKRSTSKMSKVTRGTDTSTRDCDLNVPIEWYRYNLIDAVDALEYSLSRLHKLKKEATTMYLRTRSVSEMRNLHKSLDRLLNTSVSRFNEIRQNINKEMKQYIAKKAGTSNTSEDDDDVEILPDMDDNDDPIFIDENSVESNIHENPEVDLTGMTSEHNNSSDKSVDKNTSNIENDPLMDSDDLNADIGEIPPNSTLNDENVVDNSKGNGDIEKNKQEPDVHKSSKQGEGYSPDTEKNEKEFNGNIDCNEGNKEETDAISLKLKIEDVNSIADCKKRRKSEVIEEFNESYKNSSDVDDIVETSNNSDVSKIFPTNKNT